MLLAKLDCPEPAEIDYGSVSHTGLSAGSIATYGCMRGFQMSGREERQCLVIGDWDGRDPSCSSKYIHLNEFLIDHYIT